MVHGVKITETALRDAHQSLLATRMRTEDMLPILPKIEQAGYYSVEMWGGATFDTCIRFLEEDPWERLKKIKKGLPRTKLQMLLRGQSLLGYRHYADDVVEKFVEKTAENGMDIFRVFDALNDFRNLKTAISSVRKAKKHVQGCISYTISPIHNNKIFVTLAKELVDLGVDSVCIKDMAGLLSPYDAYALVSECKSSITAPLHLHTHCTSGFALMTVLKAIEAGVDAVDTAISSISLGTSQPPTEVVVAALKGTQHETGLDLRLLGDISRYFAEIRKKYKDMESSFTGCDTAVLTYQIPGGMLSNMEKQLKEAKALDKIVSVLSEVPRVRKDLGYPPLVTPTSQIVGTQAVLNVIAGERYKVVTKETRELVKGMYGKPPGEISQDIKDKILGKESPITGRPADYLEPEFEKRKKEIGGHRSDEDVLTYTLFPEVAPKFFEERGKPPVPEKKFEDHKDRPKRASAPQKTAYRVSVGGKTYSVEVEEDFGGEAPPKKMQEEPVPAETGGVKILSPLPGNIIKIKMREGDTVKTNDIILVLEAMKLEMNITSTTNGRITKILCKERDEVKAGDVLAIIKPE